MSRHRVYAERQACTRSIYSSVVERLRDPRHAFRVDCASTICVSCHGNLQGIKCTYLHVHHAVHQGVAQCCIVRLPDVDLGRGIRRTPPFSDDAFDAHPPARGREGFTTPSFGSQSNGRATQLISSHLISVVDG